MRDTNSKLKTQIVELEINLNKVRKSKQLEQKAKTGKNVDDEKTTPGKKVFDQDEESKEEFSFAAFHAAASKRKKAQPRFKCVVCEQQFDSKVYL